MKLIHYIQLLFCGAATVAANGQLIEANFDDLTAVPGGPAVLTPVPTLYASLNYTGFNAASPAPASVAIIPESGAVYASQQADKPIISTTGTKVKYFDLYILYAGCYGSLRQGAAAPPINCTLEFTGTTAGKGNTVVKSYDYSVGNAAGIGTSSMPVRLVYFDSTFRGLKSLSVAIKKASLPNAPGVQVSRSVIDTLKYTVYT